MTSDHYKIVGPGFIGQQRVVDQTPLVRGYEEQSKWLSQAAMPRLYPRTTSSHLLDMVKKNSEASTENQLDPLDSALTESLRTRLKRLKVNYARLRQAPMLEQRFAPLLLLPRAGNRLNKQWITEDDPLRIRAMDLIAREFLSRDSSDEMREAVGVWYVNYHAPIPFGVSMYKRPSLRIDIKGEAWNTFCRFFRTFQLGLMLQSPIEEHLPRLNRSKGLGYNKRWADGHLYDIEADHLYFGPQSYLSQGGFSTWTKKDYTAVRMDWALSGALESNLRYMWDADLRDEAVLYEAFAREALTVTVEGSRRNCPDPMQFDVGKFLAGAPMAKSRLPNKKRAYDVEVAPGLMVSGEVDVDALACDLETSDLKYHLCDGNLRLNRERRINNVNNASIGVAWQYLFRWASEPLEKSGDCGFVSINEAVKSKYEEAVRFATSMGLKRGVWNADVKNSEMVVTTNHEDFVDMYPSILRHALNQSSVTVMPSAFGPRVISHALNSGVAQTTYETMGCGTFYQYELLCHLVSRLYGAVDHVALATEFFQFRSRREKLLVRLSDELYAFVFLPTDDMTIALFYPQNMDEVRLGTLLAELDAKRFRKTSFGPEAHTFGCRVGDTIEFDASRALHLWFLHEKEPNGVRCAVKQAAKFSLMPDWARDIISDVYKFVGFGDIRDYEQAVLPFQRSLFDMGYSLDESLYDMFNEYSPKDKLMLNSFVQASGLGPDNNVGLYPRESLEGVTKFFQERFMESVKTEFDEKLWLSLTGGKL